MGKISTINRMKGKESFLTPVSLVGVIVPTRMPTDDREDSEFKLVTLSGVEYLILTDSDWERVLENYRWEEVRVRGLLNAATMTIVPQWVVPHGPTGEPQRVTDAPLWKDRNLVGKIKKTVADLVLVLAYA